MSLLKIISNRNINTGFISIWRTTSSNETINIPTNKNYIIDWGDGTTTNNTNSHQYASIGDYQVRLRGYIPDLIFTSSSDLLKIKEITQIKGLRLNGGNGGIFNNCSDLDITANDLPLFLNGSGCFLGCSSLVFNNSVSNWDASKVKNTTSMFLNCLLFNQSIMWNVPLLESANNMLTGCLSYDKEIYINSLVLTECKELLKDCAVFNKNVTLLSQLIISFREFFFGCKLFNSEININTSNSSSFLRMFYECNVFNKSVLNINTVLATEISFMFFRCYAFNQSVNHFSMSLILDASAMFRQCTLFNQPLNLWDTSNIQNFSQIFRDCLAFNQNISDWSFVSVNNMSGFMQFKGSEYDTAYMDDLYIKLDQDLVFANMVNVNISFGSINYTSNGAAARASLINKGFIITSGGQV
jgi:hypothetical protein